ncbi:hypothetical protein KY339_02425 [Candidatus Woesearchaeota archaeon]|nr:hypothetical protein [Candidatus Woesearchaeota archaeon]
MQKKAQAARMLTYVLAIIVAGAILILGYKGVMTVRQSGETVVEQSFRTDLTNTIRQGSTYDYLGFPEIQVPAKYTEICFIDQDLIDTESAPQTIWNKYPIIADSIEGGIRNNIFPMPEGEPFEVGPLEVREGMLCIQVTTGKIKFRVQGLADKTRVSKAE